MSARRWLAAALVVLAACGGDGDAATTSRATSPSTTSMSTIAPTTTATEAPAAPSTSVAATDARNCTPAPVFDPSGPIRDQWVDHLVSCGFTAEEAGCLFDHIKFDEPDVAAGDPEAMLPAFQACFIDQSRIDEIGGE